MHFPSPSPHLHVCCIWNSKPPRTQGHTHPCNLYIIIYHKFFPDHEWATVIVFIEAIIII